MHMDDGADADADGVDDDCDADIGNEDGDDDDGAAKKLNVAPENCIAFEDSYSGLLAAKKANMQTIVVPASAEFMDEKFAISGLKLRSLSAFEGACLD